MRQIEALAQSIDFSRREFLTERFGTSLIDNTDFVRIDAVGLCHILAGAFADSDDMGGGTAASAILEIIKNTVDKCIVMRQLAVYHVVYGQHGRDAG